jgi:hypothetical protein
MPDRGKDLRTIDFARVGKIAPGRIFPPRRKTRQLLPGAAEIAGAHPANNAALTQTR